MAPVGPEWLQMLTQWAQVGDHRPPQGTPRLPRWPSRGTQVAPRKQNVLPNAFFGSPQWPPNGTRAPKSPPNHHSYRKS